MNNYRVYIIFNLINFTMIKRNIVVTLTFMQPILDKLLLLNMSKWANYYRRILY